MKEKLLNAVIEIGRKFPEFKLKTNDIDADESVLLDDVLYSLAKLADTKESNDKEITRMRNSLDQHWTELKKMSDIIFNLTLKGD